MNKVELIDKLAEKLSMDKKEVTKVLEGFEELVISSLQKGEEVTLTGFGTWLAKFRSARGGVNPQNPSERIQVPAVTVPKFRAGKTLKDSLKKKAEVETPEVPDEPKEEEVKEEPQSSGEGM
jgi:DNA-binding protein HU-beta